MARIIMRLTCLFCSFLLVGSAMAATVMTTHAGISRAEYHPVRHGYYKPYHYRHRHYYPRQGVVVATGVYPYAYGYTWVWGRYGSVPRGAVFDGYYGGYTTYVCRANYRGNTYRGKLVPGRGCYVNYYGRMFILPIYRVMVR